VTEWDQILQEEWYSREEPEEIVAEFFELLKNKSRNLRVLDLGCGAGRHVVFMAKREFEAYGINFSKTGLNLTKSRLQQENLKGHIAKCDMKNLPFTDSCFDSLICLHTIYHQKFEEIKRTVSEIKRVLKKSGLVLINFLSKQTHSYGMGKEVEKNTFAREDGVEKGILHHFTDEEEIRRLFKDFKIVNLELKERKIDGALRSRWILIAEA